MSLQLSFDGSRDAWIMTIPGLKAWPDKGISSYLIREDRLGIRRALPPFREDLVGQGAEAFLTQVPTIPLMLFRFEEELVRGSASPPIRERYLARLKAFPASISSQIIVPEKPIILRLENSEFVVGHTQRFVSNAIELGNYLDPDWRAQRGIKCAELSRVLLSLVDAIYAIHAVGAVRGEMNPANFGVVGETVYCWDMLGMSFGEFACKTLFEDFVAPWLLSPDERLRDTDSEARKLHAPHSRLSDYYALTAMVFQAFTGAHPYGGRHRRGAQEVELRSQRIRSMRRVPITDPEVTPKWRFPPEVMGERLLNHCHKVFREGYRGPLPRTLLSELEWDFCPHPECSMEFAGYACPCYRSRKQIRHVDQAFLARARFRAVLARINHSA